MDKPLSGALSAPPIKHDLLVLRDGPGSSTALSFLTHQLRLINAERIALSEGLRRDDAMVTRLVWRDSTHLKHVAIRVLLRI